MSLVLFSFACRRVVRSCVYCPAIVHADWGSHFILSLKDSWLLYPQHIHLLSFPCRRSASFLVRIVSSKPNSPLATKA